MQLQQTCGLGNVEEGVAEEAEEEVNGNSARRLAGGAVGGAVGGVGDLAGGGALAGVAVVESGGKSTAAGRSERA